MGIIRKAVRGTTFLATGVPLAHKHSKKDKIVRNTAAIADVLERQAAASASAPPPSLAAAPPPPGPPAGWYGDPWGHAAQRWWDGNAWTAHVA